MDGQRPHVGLLARALAPGAWLLRQLPVWGKVTVIAAVLAAPLGVALPTAIGSARGLERVSRDALSGVPAIVALNDLGLSLGRCAPRTPPDPAAGASLVQAMTDVTRALAAAAVDARVQEHWRQLRSTLRTGMAGTGGGCPAPETLVAPGGSQPSALDSYASLAVHVADDTGLTLDPTRATFYLQSMLTGSVPRLAAALTELRGRLSSPASSSRDRAMAAADAGNRGYDAALALRLALDQAQLPSDSSVRRGLEREVTALLRQTADIQSSLDDWAHGPQRDPPPAASAAKTLRILAGAERLGALAEGSLTARLATRAAHQRSLWVRSATLGAAAVVVVLYLLLALAWAMSRDLRAIRRRLVDAVDGRPDDREEEPSGRDELASIGAAVTATGDQITSLMGQLRATAARHESFVRQSSDVTIVTDADGTLLYVSPSLVHVLGHRPQDWVGRRLADVTVPADGRAVVEALAQVRSGSETGELRARFAHADGRPRHIAGRFKDARSDEVVGGLVWNLRDTTEEQELADQLTLRAFHDDLTGLANRALFVDRLQRALDRAARTRTPMAVCVLDLDGFKAINDAHGHRVGDELLRAVAGRLRTAVRPQDTVGRLGGDEFGIVLEEVSTPEALVIAGRVCADLERPVTTAGLELSTAASVGIALVSGGQPTPDQALHEADMAMYSAKSAGRGQLRVFSTDMLRSDPRAARAEVLALLDDEQGIEIHFQPICDLGTGEVVGYEALARFPGRSDRDVSAWFDLARDCGLGPELEAAALQRALGTGDRPAGTYLSVNVSPTTIGSPLVQSALAGDLTGIMLEVTEDSRIDQADFERAIQPLRARGARVAVDDTGAGYANLTHLVRMRPEMVKLDRQLVSNLHERPEKRALVEALVSFCHRTGAALCAEGVERVEELVTLSDLGVRLAQGWFFAAPSPRFAQPADAAVRACRSRPPDDAELVPVAASLTAAATPVEVSSALESLLDRLRADELSLSLVSAGRALAVSPLPGTAESVYLLADYPSTLLALETGTVLQVRVDDPEADQSEVRVLRRLGFGSLLLVPVLHAGRGVAVLEVYARATQSWPERDLRLMSAVAEEIGMTVARIRGRSDPAGRGGAALEAPDRARAH